MLGLHVKKSAGTILTCEISTGLSHTHISIASHPQPTTPSHEKNGIKLT